MFLKIYNNIITGSLIGIVTIMRPCPVETDEARTMFKHQLAEAVDLTNKGKRVVFFYKKLLKDGKHATLDALYFGSKLRAGDDYGKIKVPISLKVGFLCPFIHLHHH